VGVTETSSTVVGVEVGVKVCTVVVEARAVDVLSIIGVVVGIVGVLGADTLASEVVLAAGV
jgi:hypothetical protein